MNRLKVKSKVSKKADSFPKIHFDKENNFVSIKIVKGVENKSYEKDGFIFCENKLGQIIEVQILDLTKLIKKN